MTLSRGLKIALAAILAIAAAPFVLALGAGSIATVLGCELNEADVHSCAVFGVDLGYPLYAAGLTGLILLFGLPIAGIAFLIWLVVAAGALFIRWRRLDY
ncbi:MAG: hypothetical protein U1E81_04405 [Xanthobacteraceae bacterium]